MQNIVQGGSDSFDVPEIFERAEVRLLELFEYEAGHSEERRIQLMINSGEHIVTICEIVKAFLCMDKGGPIFLCAESFFVGCSQGMVPLNDKQFD